MEKAKELKELNELINIINNKGKFELMGGAGSGKTTTLLNLISEIPDKKLLVISFTNVAKNEVIERFKNKGEHQQMEVRTIHSFARKFMKDNYQLFSNFMEQHWLEYVSKKIKPQIEKAKTKYKGFGFSGTVNFFEQEKTGVIYLSNKNLIKVFTNAILNDEKLAFALDNIYDAILIDEYQDTDENLIKLLTLNNINKTAIGFFGDPKQRIYEDVLTIDYKENIKSFYKKDNYRSSIEIVNFINHYRDDFQQIAKNNDVKNFNSKIKVIEKSTNTAQFVESIEKQEGITFDAILHLTNAQRLLNIEPDAFDDDSIFKSKEYKINKSDFVKGTDFTKFIFKLLQFIDENKEIQEEFWVKEEDLYTGDKILVNENDKVIINEKFNKIINDIRNMNSVIKARDILNKICDDKDLMKKINFFVNEDVLKSFEFSNILKIKWKTIQNAYDLSVGKYPNKTMHSIKGQEYNNVAIFLDSTWNLYNFCKYYNGDYNDDCKKKDRIENLLYVSISRAKKNLFFFILSNQIINPKDIYKVNN